MKVLPELTGSEKQIAWAKTIRINILVQYEDFLDMKKESTSYDKMLAVQAILESTTDSKWWIEHREYETYYIDKLFKEILFQYKLFNLKKEEK